MSSSRVNPVNPVALIAFASVPGVSRAIGAAPLDDWRTAVAPFCVALVGAILGSITATRMRRDDDERRGQTLATVAKWIGLLSFGLLSFVGGVAGAACIGTLLMATVSR